MSGKMKHLLPTRRGRAKRPSDASVLLHAIIVALRDDRPKTELLELVKCYPRILNRSNPILSLTAEIAALKEQLGEKCDQQELFAAAERELEAWQNKRPRHGFTLPERIRKFFTGTAALATSAPKDANGR